MPDTSNPTSAALDAFWMPFTPNKAYKAKPKILSSAKGMTYFDAEGRSFLDGSSGLWCVNAGHGRETIAKAISDCAHNLDYVSTFNMGHPLAFQFAERLSALLPYDLKRIFYTNSGSESDDTALKIALAYQKARGQGSKTRLIGRERAYHGVGFGGISVGGIMRNRAQYGVHLPGVDHLMHTHGLEANLFSKGEPDHGGIDMANHLERLIGLHDASTIAAVIVEPVAGSTGVLVPPKGYLKRLREICDKYDILLIFDEVITGFGRLGSAFGADYFGVRPDLMCLAKGISNATVPMGAVAVANRIYDTMMQTSATPIELFHGYTYSGHPLACAAGLATLDIYEKEGLFARAAEMAPYFEAGLHSLKGLPHIIDIRNLGLMGAFDLDSRENAVGARGFEAYDAAFEAGLVMRVSGDTVALSPPLIVERTHIDRMIEILAQVLKNLN